MDVKVTYNQPAHMTPPNSGQSYPHPVLVEKDSGCFKRNQRNKPQSNSVGSAGLIFISGGMNIAFGTGPISTNFVLFSTHMKICWFIAAIIGAILGAVLCNRLPKKVLTMISSVLVVIGGILFVSLNKDVDAIIAARYLDGLGNGLLIAPTLVMAGEEAVKYMRGMVSSSVESLCFALGIYLEVIFSAIFIQTNSLRFGPIEVHGCLSIVYGIMAFILSYFLIIESPVSFLVRDEEEKALDALRRLQRPFIVTTETIEQLEEHKRYISVNKEMSFGQSAIAGLPALFKLSIYRGLLAMSYSLLLNFGFLYATLLWQGPFAIWTYIVYASCRWLGALCSAMIMDSAGRKYPMLVGALICGAVAVAVGTIFTIQYDYSYNLLVALNVLYFIFELFAGIFIAPSSVYLSEAFPLAIKSYYIAVAFTIEMLVQIIVCSVYPDGFNVYILTIGGFMLAFFIFGIFFMPETKRTTLREAQELFRKIK